MLITEDGSEVLYTKDPSLSGEPVTLRLFKIKAGQPVWTPGLLTSWLFRVTMT